MAASVLLCKCAQSCLSHHRVFQKSEALFSGKEANYNAVDSDELTVFIPGHAEFRQLVWLMSDDSIDGWFPYPGDFGLALHFGKPNRWTPVF